MHGMRKFAAPFGMLAMLAATLGCGNSKPRTDGAITGKVTFKGKVVQVGAVIFTAKDPTKRAPPFHIGIIKSGVYTAPNVPAGEALVGVTNDPDDTAKLIHLANILAGKGGPKMAKLPPKGDRPGKFEGLRALLDSDMLKGREMPVEMRDKPTEKGGAGPIPAKYLDPLKSGLPPLEVKIGDNTHDVTITKD